MAKISKIEEGSTAGVWATAADGIVGLVAADSIGPYVCFYGPGRKQFPQMALFVNKDGDPILQLAEDGSRESVKQVKVADIVNAANLVKGEAFGDAAPEV